jgi:hypothetical protein
MALLHLPALHMLCNFLSLSLSFPVFFLSSIAGVECAGRDWAGWWAFLCIALLCIYWAFKSMMDGWVDWGMVFLSVHT